MDGLLHQAGTRLAHVRGYLAALPTQGITAFGPHLKNHRSSWTKDIHYEDMSDRDGTTWPMKTAAFQKITAATGDASACRPRQGVSLTTQERAQLLRWVRARKAAYRLVTRSRIILMASEGRSAPTIAARMNVTPATV